MLNDGQEAGFIVSENAMSTVCAPAAQLSVALTVNVAVPDPVGVPEIRPEEVMFKPEGNDPEIMLNATGDCPPEV